MKKRRFAIIPTLAVALTMLFAACDNDDSHIPTQRLDLVEFISNENGVATQMVLDNGDTLSLLHPAGGFASDTVCRCLAVFRPVSETRPNTVNVTSIGQIITLPPTMYHVVYADPVDVVSAWTGGNYLNLRLSVRTNGSSHAFGFAYLGSTTAENGAETLQLALYNNSGKDTEYFSRTVYLSCSLKSFINAMQRGRDSVSIKINEYDKGFMTYAFAL